MERERVDRFQRTRIDSVAGTKRELEARRASQVGKGGHANAAPQFWFDNLHSGLGAWHEDQRVTGEQYYDAKVTDNDLFEYVNALLCASPARSGASARGNSFPLAQAFVPNTKMPQNYQVYAKTNGKQHSSAPAAPAPPSAKKMITITRGGSK